MTDPRLPHLPERIDRLFELATDLWWVWNNSAREVFRQLDFALWRATAHNPVRMLRQVPQERLDEAAHDPVFLRLYDSAMKGLDRTRSGEGTWWAQRHGRGPARPIAYFSAEFALHQSLPIYAGGLGVLAGDHCKEACDLGLPFVAVGFMYPQGYFHQSITADGWQEERYRRINWERGADRAGAPAGRTAVHHRRAARPAHGAGLGVACQAGTHAPVSARHRSGGERALGSRAHGAALRRRS